MGLRERFRSWRQLQVAVNRVIAQNDPTAVESLLRNCPAEGGKIARRARGMTEAYPSQALLLAKALAKCEAPEALDLLRLMAASKSGWDRLGDEALRDLQRYLVNQGEAELLSEVRKRLDDKQRAWLLPEVGAYGFLDEFARIHEAGSLRLVVRRIADYLEEVGLGRRVPDQGLDNAVQAVPILWNHGQVEEALQLLALVAVARPAILGDPRFLDPVAEELPGWIPRADPASLEGLPEGFGQYTEALHPSPPVPPPCVVRAADLIADFPQARWVNQVRRAWLAVDDLVRRDPSDEKPEENPLRLLAAQSIAAALGACAALDPQLRVIVRDEKRRKSLYETLSRDIDHRNHLVDEHGKLVELYHTGKAVVESIADLRGKIAESDDAIARVREELRGQMTPAALLLQTVADEQAYPLDVRQGAAWGLHCILRDGALEQAARNKVDETLRIVLQHKELDEAALRDRIVALVPQGDKHLRELLSAAERYAADQDAVELDTTAGQLVPAVPLLAKEIRDCVDAARRSQGDNTFGERVLRLLPDARLPEFLAALRRSLRWMVELVERRTNGSRPLEENLQWIVTLVAEELPGIMDFLSRYPLRLMALDRHRQILGQYARDKVHLQLWTRYTPPRWFPGANPDEIGKVHHRYLDLDDRSSPNAMGLYYRLFEHPVLVLPVLYHEFLHYGGPDGDPSRGICNEAEVLLREVLFARYLLARLAPEDDAALPKYEEGLAAAIKGTELVGLAKQLFFEFEDDGSLGAINQQIADIYGSGIDEASAKAEVGAKIRYWNRTIELENQTDVAKRSWCPEIDWPYLDSSETCDLTDRFCEVLCEALQRDHRLGPEHRDRVLAEPICRGHRGKWFDYRCRPGALAELARQFPPAGLDRATLEALVQRFEMDDPRRHLLGDILRLLRTRDQAGPGGPQA